MSNSKLSVRVLKGMTCTEIYHPGETCAQMVFSNSKTGFPICAAALAPLILIPAILKKRTKITKNDVKKTFYKWLRVSICFHCTSILAQLSMCILTKALGRVYVSTFFFLPVSLGSLVVFVLPAGELAASDLANYMPALGIEAALRHFDGIFSHKAFRTFAFMCASAVLMDAIRMKKMPNDWWILQPASTRNAPASGTPSIPSPVIDHFVTTEYHTCSHKGSCDRYVFEGIRKYFILYLAFDAGKILIGHGAKMKKSPASILKVILKHWNGKLLTFIVGYASMYRLFSCLLNRKNKKESRATIGISSFLSASAYYFYPNYTILAQGSLTVLRVLWQYLSEVSQVVNDISRKLPLSKIIYVFTTGLMFHLRAFHPYICASAILKATDFASSSRTGRCLQNFTRMYLGYS